MIFYIILILGLLFPAEVLGASLWTGSRHVGPQHDPEQRGLKRGVGGQVADLALQVGGDQPAQTSIKAKKDKQGRESPLQTHL